MAWEIPLINVQLFTFYGLLAALGIVMLLAYFWPPANKIPGINAVPKQYKAIGGVVLILIAGFAAGSLSMPDQKTGTADPTTTADYYSTSDIEVYTYNELDGSTASGDVQFMTVGATEEDYVQQTGDAKTLRTATTSSGSVTMNGWDAEKYPQAIAMVDISGYYQKITSQDMRVEKDNDDNTKAVVLRATDLGTVDASNSDTTPSISAGSSSSYTIFYGNSEDDSEIRYGAIKFDNSNNCTLDSVDDGGSLKTIDGTQYVVLEDETIGGNEYKTVTVTISVDGGASEASFDWTYNDLFGQYGADTFPTDSNILSVSSSTQSVTISV